MKPDWNGAPKWANFLAQDPDGDWYWYEQRPFWNHVKDRWGVGFGRCVSHAEWLADEPYKVYMDSLETRPIAKADEAF